MHRKYIIYLILSFLLVLSITIVASAFDQEIDTANNISDSFNLTDTGALENEILPLQNSRSDEYVEGYELKTEKIETIPDDEDRFSFSSAEIAISLLIITGVGSIFVVSVLAVVMMVARLQKKKEL